MKFFYIGFLYLTYFYVAIANSDPYSLTRKNLIFVYDAINPGIEYVTFVQGVVKIHDEFVQSKPFFNKILVVFPFQKSIETITFDRHTNIEKSVEEYLLEERPWIEAEKTESEESRVLTGLWTGLHNAEPHSLVYVITNAKPEDRPMMQYIECEINNKMIEVGFIIQQNFNEHNIALEYQEISLRSNGLILNVHSDSQIMTFLPDLLTTTGTYRKVNLLTIDNHPEKRHTILVDEYLEEITIASWTYGINGEYIMNHFNHSEYSCTPFKPQRTRFLCALKTKVASYTGILTGDLFINVDTNSYFFGLRVFGISYFNFNYGFSVDELSISCVNKMINRPMMDTTNYIYISSNNQYEAVFTSCVIISIDNSFVREIPLQRVTSNSDKALYSGTFVPGSEAFYIRVTASINGKIVHRMSPFAISPFRKQTLEIETFDIEFSTQYTNTTYYGNSRPKRQIIKFN